MIMRICFSIFVLIQFAVGAQVQPLPVVVTDYTSYNVGDTLRLRLQPAAPVAVSIRYAGETTPIASGVRVSGSEYTNVWKIPQNARTGRYELDVTSAGAKTITNAASFAVHRQLVKITSVELDKTFYTSGDTVNPIIVVENVSDQPLQNLQVEFEPYTYPWIAPAPDEKPLWKHIVDRSLSLPPGARKEFRVTEAAVVQAEQEPVAIYYSVVIRDSRHPDHIYDLAFAPPAFTVSPHQPLPKQYPFLYLYWHLTEVPKSEAYRQFYRPEYVSKVIRFNTSHTTFPAGVSPVIAFSIKQDAGSPKAAYLRARVLDSAQHELENRRLLEPIEGSHTITLTGRPPGLYTLELSLGDAHETVFERNQLQWAANALPKSILVFCAHQDDDTAHPGIIRAAVENHIPIHFVYLTSGDAGGCDRFYMHSCDAARAMDFGEVRMEEARASLHHLGILRENIFFLGLPDGGLEQIWRNYPNSENPYLSVLLASEHAPYREAAVPNLPYALGPVVATVKQFIRRFNPDLIITGHPDERHVDHRTNNWIVVKAMRELLQEGLLSRDTKLLVDSVYGPLPSKRAPYHYEKQTFFVSGEAAKLGQEATWYYQSQDGNHQQANLVDFDKLPREEAYPHFWITDWPDHAGWNEVRPHNQ